MSHSNVNNVVSLFDRKNKSESHATTAEEEKLKAGQPLLSDAIKKNQENSERLRKERLKANESVLKSYGSKLNF